jgi:hypothetical protein
MRFVAITVALLLAAPCFDAQTLQTPSQIVTQWRWYAQTGDNLISDIRPKFRQVLDPGDRTLESRLEYEITITGNTNAFALRGGRTIVTAQFLQIIDSMATVMSAAQMYNKPECLGSYIEYLAEGTRNNSRLVVHGQQPKAVAMAFGYWQLRPDVCGGLTETVFRANKKADDLRELMIYSSLIYLIGHEFSHHKYHDNIFKMVTEDQKHSHLVQGLDVSREVTPSEQMVKENRADLFSFHKMIEMDYPPIGAMPVLVFFLGFEGPSPEQSADADHPSAIVRFNDMIDATEQDSEFMELVHNHHLEQQWGAFVAFGKQLQTAE